MLGKTDDLPIPPISAPVPDELDHGLFRLARRQWFIPLVAIVGILSATARADERTNVVALLRTAAERVSSQPFSDKELWSELNAKENGGVLVEIGLAQIALDDLEGALQTAALLPTPDECLNCEPYYRFLKDLAVQLVRVGKDEAGLQVLSSHRKDETQTTPSTWELMAIARGHVEAKKFDAAKQTYREIATATQGDAFGLCTVAKAQFGVGDHDGVRETRRLIEIAAERLPMMGQERGILLAKMAVLYFLLGDGAASRRTLQSAPLALNSETDAWEDAQAVIAAAHAKIGDFAGAIRAAERIPEKSSQRETAYKDIALLQWAQEDLVTAQETALLLNPVHDLRDLVLLEIVKTHALKGNFKQALATAAHVKGELRHAQAILDIAAAQALQGKVQDARALTSTLVFPRAPRGFAFDRPKTWKPKETIRPVISIASLIYDDEMEDELVAAAVRCHVLLKGGGTIPRIKEMNRWDVRKAAEAQAGTGDAAGALRWSAGLSDGRRLSALIGVAQGLADSRHEGKTSSTEPRLSASDMLRKRFNPAYLDD
jgi:hypothetical protein